MQNLAADAITHDKHLDLNEDLRLEVCQVFSLTLVTPCITVFNGSETAFLDQRLRL